MVVNMNKKIKDNRGKLLWKHLEVVHMKWYEGNYGEIDIHIPIVLNIPYDAMDETPWYIRKAIYEHLLKLHWPVEGIGSLYFNYHKNFYHLQIHTTKRETFRFYKKVKINYPHIKFDWEFSTI